MYKGVSSSSSDQFHQFMASSRTASSLIPINNNSNSNNVHMSCFSLDHHDNNPSFSAAFDNTYTSSSSLNTQQALHHQESSPAVPNHSNMTSKDIDTDIDDDDDDDDVKHDVVGSRDPWSNEEVLALLRLRSTMDIWFPDFTWHHISRKLGELGFKRSAEQCKERFDQESCKHLDSSNTTVSTVNYNKLNNYRDMLLSELDEFYPPGNQEQAPPVSSSAPNHMNQLDQKLYKNHMELENEDQNLAAPAETTDPPQESEQVLVAERRPTQSMTNKKRKKKRRRDKFEIFKGFCQAVVNKIMAQQEELHNKMIEDIVKRDEEKIAIDEARKKEEIDRLQKEMEIRAKEQAIANERHATLIDFLKKFTSQDDDLLLKVNNNDPLNNKLETPTSSSSTILAQQNKPKHTNSSTASDLVNITSLSSSCLVNANTSMSAQTNETHLELWTTKNAHDERGGEDHIGKRWPRDEVLALINLRCKMNSSTNMSNNGDHHDHHPAKGPLWERISQGMMELGYKRNSKRCKEKWENINKYFRKTKDINKKRSVNSRTCPYFQQLSCLYNSQGTLLVNVAPTNVPDNP